MSIYLHISISKYTFLPIYILILISPNFPTINKLHPSPISTTH